MHRSLADTVLWGYPMFMHVADSRLVVYDHLAQLHLVVLDWRVGTVLGRAGRSGEGPREVRGVTHLSTDHRAASHGVVVFDAALRRTTMVDPTRASAGMITGSRRLTAPGYPQSAHVSEAGALVGGMFADGPLLWIPKDGQAEPRGVHPFSQADFADRSARYTANRYTLAASPDGRRVALAYNYLNRIDIYTSAGALVQTITTSPAVGPPQLVPNRGRLQWDSVTVTAFNGVSASREHIYAVLCNCTRDQRVAQTEPYEILVYTWSGVPVARLSLDHPPTAIAVLPDDSRLFAAYVNPIPGVGEWMLHGAIPSVAGATGGVVLGNER